MTTLYKPKAKYCESGNSLFRIFLQNSISEYRKSFFLILLVFGCVVKSYADCTAPTGTYTWASYLTGAGAGCTGILTIPNGATITLGASSSPEIVNIPAAITRIVIQSGGRISFTGKGQLKLPVGTSISIAQTSPTSGAGAAISGDCNNNNEIWIGTLQYAVCAGGNACVTFSALISSGGTTIINPTITVSGGSGNTICFNNFGLNSVLSGYIGGTPTYSWSQTAGPGTSSFSPGTSVASPSVTVSTPGTYSYRITVTSPLSSNCASTVSTSTADVTVTVRPTPTATIGETTTVCQNSTAQLVTFNNPQNIPVQISYSLNGIPQPPVSVGASTSATVSAPTTVAGSFVYTLNSVQYQVAPFCTNSVSGSATVTINGITPGTISKGAVNPGPACAPLDPNQTMAANSATAATGSAPTLTYLWEQSINGGAWTAASIVSPETSNTGVQFNPGPMNETTKLRRIATSTVNGVACSAVSNELEYVVYPLPVVAAITPTGTINVCEGSTVQLTNATSGGVWRSNNGANVTVSSTGLVTGVSAAAQTSLNISYTVTNSNGCVTTVNRTVNVIALPTVTSASAVCVGNTFNLTPNTGGTWISNNPTIATVTSAGLVTGVAPGSATFTFTNTAAPNCSKTTSAVSVTPKPTATINSANTSVCDGASTNITGTVTATGAWTITLSNGATATGTGNGTFSITVTPSSNAIYTITSLIDANCSAISTDLTGSTIVNVKPKPTAPTVTVVDNCDGSSTLTASAYSGTLLWSTGETAESINVLTAGNYSVTHTVDGCVSPGANATAAPKSTPIAPTVTVVDNCDGTSTLTASAYSGTLLWSTGETAESINVLTAGNYSVTQTVDGCVSPEANATAAPKSTPIAPTVTVVDNCEGTSTLTASAYSGTLLWSTGETAESINVLTAGNYSVTQTVEGCVSPVANATAVPKSTPIAPTVTVVDNCDGSSTLTASAYSGTLLWSTGETAESINVLTAGNYSVTQTVEGCVSPVANATAAPKSTPIAPTVTVVDNCDGSSTLTASAYSGTLLWSTGETAESINVLTAGNYSVTQTVDGCVSLEANATAAPKSTPIAPTVTVVDNCEGTSTLTASAYSGTLLWSTGETAESINVLTAGNYSVTQTVDGRVSPVANATAVPKSTPIAPAVASRREFCKDEEITALTATGTNLLWYENAVTGIGSSTAIIPQTSVVGTSTYYVTQTINGCESERAAIEVVIKAECFELPVILSEFKVRKQEQTVLISWKTTREINSDRFEIERSTDPKNSFEKIATVKSHDTESGAQYQFEDNQLPQAESVYYRLKMIDQDETFSYSKIQSVKAEQYIVTEIYPNPTSDYINIKTSNWKNVQSFNILDMNGTSVLNFTGSHLSSKIDISKLKSGNYLIDIIRKDGKTDCKRFVIIR